MSCFNDIPNEILFEIFSAIPLKGLIAARGVNRTWRNFIQYSSIPPARRALLELYDDVITCSGFIDTREEVISGLHSFDRYRDAYVASLEKQLNGDLPPGIFHCIECSQTN